MMFRRFVLILLLASQAWGQTPSPPQRDLWSRSSERFMRQWLVLGPVAGKLEDDLLAPSGGEASVHPTPGAPQAATGNASLRWLPHSSWQDVVNVAGAVGGPEYRGSAAATEVAYAFTTVRRENDGNVVLSFGSQGYASVWVNGAPVRSSLEANAFAYDQYRITAQLKRGDNSLLVKVAHRSGPWLFALRVLEPGTLVPSVAEIVPTIVPASANQLAIQTDRERKPSASRVDVTVIAAGGRVAGHARVIRGETATFATEKWSEGAYEARLTTTSSWGEPTATHLAWYKGDPRAAAARLVAAAKVAPLDVTGATTRMLAEMVLDRVGGSVDQGIDDGWPAIYSPLMEYEELELAAAGKPGPVRPWGFVRLAWIDDVDGSPQFCRAYLPPKYVATRPSPALMFLHGYNPPNPTYVRWWSVADRHSSIAEHYNVIYLEPHARGNSQYLGIGEKDVLRCLEEAKRRFNVDNDRVYLAGESMGGSGTWLIASRHPDLFAAAAPTHGGWDYRLIPGFGFDNPRATRPLELFAAEAQSSFAGAEGLLNVPLLVTHGDQDQAVTVEYSRHALRMLSRWGYDIQYDEIPGRGHEDLGQRDAIAGWLVTHRRVQAPRHMRIRAMDLAGASAYWVEVQAWREPLRPIEVDAEVIEPGVIRLDTVNVAGLKFSLPREFRGIGPNVRVVWNGNDGGATLSADGSAVVALASDRPLSHDKTRGLEGRLSSLFLTPFAIVIGTRSANAELKRMCLEKGQTLAQLWNNWQHAMPRVFMDTEVKPEDEAKYSLLLIGGAEDNLVTRRVIDRLPLTVEPDAVTVDGRKFAASDAVVQMIYPNPYAPARYVLVVAATSASGMYFWNPASYWDQSFGFPNSNVDWNIIDGRRVSLERGLGRDRTWVASGVFDRSWRRDDRWVFMGDEELRARSPLRRAPLPAPKVSASVLDSYAGAYQLLPGVVATVTRDGDGLILAPPGAPAFPLIAESETDFAVTGISAPVTFKRDARGKVTEFLLDFNNQEFHATRLP